MGLCAERFHIARHRLPRDALVVADGIASRVRVAAAARMTPRQAAGVARGAVALQVRPSPAYEKGYVCGAGHATCPPLTSPRLVSPLLTCSPLTCPRLTCPRLTCPPLTCPRLTCPRLTCPPLTCLLLAFRPFRSTALRSSVYPLPPPHRSPLLLTAPLFSSPHTHTLELSSSALLSFATVLLAPPPS
eukprot:364930-Chlamydomonas_euryale.AAC.33